MRKPGSDLIIVRVDGGICSQIAFVALGLYLQHRGFAVKYDLSWFRDCGTDLTGLQVRNWDFPVAFPGIRLEEATAAEILAVKSCRVRVGQNVDSYAPPLYVGGYPDRGEAVFAERDLLRQAFQPVLDAPDTAFLSEIGRGVSCAIHVRRGDLANGNEFYGGATSADYYLRAMKMVRGLEPGVRFYVFSDGPDWVRENILPVFGGDVRLMESNGSDRGYVDLFLLSRCDYVISSVGSLGVMGAILSSRCRMLVMSHARDWVSERMPNVVYVNDDRGRRAVSAGGGVLTGLPEDSLHGMRGRLLRWWARLGESVAGVDIQ